LTYCGEKNDDTVGFISIFKSTANVSWLYSHFLFKTQRCLLWFFCSLFITLIYELLRRSVFPSRWGKRTWDKNSWSE